MDSHTHLPIPAAGDATAIEPCPVPDCTLPVDLVLVSKEDKCISAHTVNLGLFSNGFPPASASGELARDGLGSVERVQLEETADVLMLLLKFMHHAHLPDLEMHPFQTAGVAEAAEKYEVFSAVALAKVYMKRRAKYKSRSLSLDDAAEVLFYGLKHGYNDIADDVALETIDMPLDRIVAQAMKAGISSHHILQWVLYREAHQRKLQRILVWSRCKKDSKLYFHVDSMEVEQVPCTQWARLERDMVGSFANRPGSIFEFASAVSHYGDYDENFDYFDDEPENFLMTCDTCKGFREEWVRYAREIADPLCGLSLTRMTLSSLKC
ncbi:hypothetical protein CVT24_008236 [Panaeolus cyanescens]|uniref:BTB domain-containing protein n=1 Tax=Panaeolus cyanescens TaxID=181874 RepID=A0A409YR30_9AGAR|nr:hypothetical protein CVT24_008236 [Panaeolus cyanescens]